MTSQSYTGKHVVITGGSSGIGLAVAKLYASQGAFVTIIGRDKAKLDSAIRELPNLSRVLGLSADVANRDELNLVMLRASEEFGTPDVLVCSAGIARPDYFEELHPEHFKEAMDINFHGTENAVRSVLSRMKSAGRGHIVLMSSGAALIGLFGYTAYGASKFAVRGFGESLNVELADSPIGVSIVYPADVDTPQLAQENETKPPELKSLTGSSKPWTAEATARLIVRGVERKRFVITKGVEMHLLVHGHSLLGPLLRKYFKLVARKAQRD